MDDGFDLAIISGSGELPLIIKKQYKNKTVIMFPKNKYEKFVERPSSPKG